jgi:hypothetical protein
VDQSHLAIYQAGYFQNSGVYRTIELLSCLRTCHSSDRPTATASSVEILSNRHSRVYPHIPQCLPDFLQGR